LSVVEFFKEEKEEVGGEAGGVVIADAGVGGLEEIVAVAVFGVALVVEHWAAEEFPKGEPEAGGEGVEEEMFVLLDCIL
jgi:hypothetical protein